ncbi:hypothetical protein UY3_16395 [Chelonia mydas]|uniref:Uncharacterized protein n=1 Tax=Chelonia mydas TaxID=8469 RepID=M7B336_CHEMY|nr:hypothetical protein UY3_16395 [Chelonia mydas]
MHLFLETELYGSANRGSQWPRFAAPGQWELLEAAWAKGQIVDAAGKLTSLACQGLSLHKRRKKFGNHCCKSLEQKVSE